MTYDDIKTEQPIPPPAVKCCSKYPFHELEIGQCFDTADCRVYSAASQYTKRHGVTLTTRKLPDGTIRVWRTA